MSVSRSELKVRVTAILKDADLESTSAKKVRKSLEDAFDTDLSSRKEEVNAIIQEVMDENEEEDKSEDEGGKQSSDYEPEESPAPPPKKKKAPAKKRKGNDSDSDDDNESEEEWSASKSKAKKATPAKSRKRKDSDDNSSDEDFKPTKAKRKSKGGGGGNGFTKPLNLSEDLAAIVGKDVAPRHEVVKQVWAYIKENNLQDPSNKQFAICDEKLKKVIGEKKFKCFGMAKYFKNHMSS
uniref:Upstream activation factor subunit UAF30 n=1 Tax=Caligus rogercresseyi TaxID=217165 RepID=C1BP73_CALRO|nr:Upstream activation factor subunit UAF30 [Caligus rogercresseyi]|eukprot:TRINITY_DN2320_c0_g1_i1.p1 TRINITY_DN2320_c0_g1~~TRINITY_DN2320_c0_g1_i1.p1  ORF type:complete len:238 (-),score=115.38 TRINITY_DN2320_c0_g1_i1:245-958(-)